MMKKNISIILVIFICAIGLMWSCNKKLDLVAPVLGTGGLAYLKIADFSPSFRQVVNGSDSFNVYVNGFKVNGPILSFGTIFPTISNLYTGVPAGPQSIRITVNGKVTPDSITLASFNKNLIAGNYYSFIITDSLFNTTESKQIFVQDDFTISDTTHFTVRFIDAILNDSIGSVKNVDIYSTRRAANIFSNISPGTVTPFVTLPYTLSNDTLIVRRPGLLYPLATLNTVVFARQRAYTLVYKGLPNATTGTKARSLVIYTNN